MTNLSRDGSIGWLLVGGSIDDDYLPVLAPIADILQRWRGANSGDGIENVYR